MVGHIQHGRAAVLGVLTFVGAFVGTALALWASSSQTVYSEATLAGGSTRIDTVAISNPARDGKQDRFVIALAGTSAAAVVDSQFYAVVRAIHGGHLFQVGEDSLTLRPDPPNASAHSGELRVLRWISDSLQISTSNPKSSSVTGARLTITPTRLP